ncbi:MAG: hypothetical protein M3540_02210 [Actinomycetota bacterium]|nr:hypothetical protein [Actinomycetota bacterium]
MAASLADRVKPRPITNYAPAFSGPAKVSNPPRSAVGAPARRVTPEVRAAFIAGAGTVGGLTKQQIEKALANPRLMLGVPVTTRSTYQVEPAAKPASSAKTIRPVRGAAAAEYCAWINNRLAWKSAWGTTSLQVTIKKQFCWNGNWVTRATGIEIYPWVSTAAATAGWKWGGASNVSNYWYVWNGHVNGGHYSKATVKFKYCPVRISCAFDRLGWISLWGHYNGSWDRNSGA